MGNENVAVKFLGEDYNGPMEILDSYVKRYEPKLYKAACNIFGDAYDYTRKYREFRDKGENDNG